jgi:hypothetical protein
MRRLPCLRRRRSARRAAPCARLAACATHAQARRTQSSLQFLSAPASNAAHAAAPSPLPAAFSIASSSALPMPAYSLLRQGAQQQRHTQRSGELGFLQVGDEGAAQQQWAQPQGAKEGAHAAHAQRKRSTAAARRAAGAQRGAAALRWRLRSRQRRRNPRAGGRRATREQGRAPRSARRCCRLPRSRTTEGQHPRAPPQRAARCCAWPRAGAAPKQAPNAAYARTQRRGTGPNRAARSAAVLTPNWRRVCDRDAVAVTLSATAAMQIHTRVQHNRLQTHGVLSGLACRSKTICCLGARPTKSLTNGGVGRAR